MEEGEMADGFVRLEEILNVTGQDDAWWASYEKKKRGAVRLYDMFTPHFQDLADAQVGRGPADMGNSPDAAFAFSTRWPKEFSKVAHDADELRDLMLETIQVGCAIFAFDMVVPDDLAEPLTPPNLDKLRARWLEGIIVADVLVPAMHRGWDRGASQIRKLQVKERLLTFYKAHGVGGFLGWRLGRFEAAGNMLFYAGALLAWGYGRGALTNDGDLLPPDLPRM